MVEEMDVTGKHSETAIGLIPHGLLDIQDGEGLAVRCLHGVVWITQSDDTRDIVVKAGQFFVLDRPGLALVAAPNGPATIVVARPEALVAKPDLPTTGVRVAAA